MLEVCSQDAPISWEDAYALLQQFASSLDGTIKKVLLIPPDYTRKHSGAGKITALLYKLLGSREIDVLPALGTHSPMTEAEFSDNVWPEIALSRMLCTTGGRTLWL